MLAKPHASLAQMAFQASSREHVWAAMMAGLSLLITAPQCQ
jgi:hypothetical protein